MIMNRDVVNAAMPLFVFRAIRLTPKISDEVVAAIAGSDANADFL